MHQYLSFPCSCARLRALLFVFLVIAVCTPSVTSQSCCDGSTGNLDCDNTTLPDLADLVTLIDYLYLNYTPLCCPAEGNIDGDPDANVDISDLTQLIDYLYVSGDETSPCDQERIISDSMRWAILQQISPVADSLLRHSDRFLDDLHAYLTTIPKFEATGIDTATQSVWGRFLDGTIYLAVDNLAPATDTGWERMVRQASTPARPGVLSQTTEEFPTGLPWSTNVRALVTVDSADNPANSLIGEMLTEHGYNIISRDASVDGLRNVGGDGVLYMMVHGGHAHMRYNRDIFLLETSTPADSLSLLKHREDILINRLAIMQVIDRRAVSSSLRLALTPDFIVGNWSDFAPNAMVVINTAGSLGPEGLTLRNLLIEKKASTCFGWSGPVDADVANFLAGFLFDRLLGANKVEPFEEPSQRAFDYRRVLDDIATRNLMRESPAGSSASHQGEFTYVAGDGDFGLLSPSIRRLSVDSSGVMIISGLFGDNPGSAGHVLIGGHPLSILSWEPTQIRAQLPDTGEFSRGRVAIEIDQRAGGPSATTRRSNEVNLTEWRGQMVYAHRDLGTLTTTIKSDIHLRADLHSYRDEPHTTPIQPVVSALAAPDASANMLGSGNHSFLDPENPDVQITLVWSGSCTFPLATPSHPNGSLNAIFDTQNYLLSLHLNTASDSCLFESRITTLGDSVGLFTPVAIDSSLYDDKVNRLISHPLEPNWDIQPGLRQSTIKSRVDSTKPVTVKWQWNTISAAYPPDPNSPR